MSFLAIDGSVIRNVLPLPSSLSSFDGPPGDCKSKPGPLPHRLVPAAGGRATETAASRGRSSGRVLGRKGCSAIEKSEATFSTSMGLRRRWDFRQKPESYRPATDELKRLLPHVSGFLLPFDHRIELSKAAQTDAFFNRL